MDRLQKLCEKVCEIANNTGTYIGGELGKVIENEIGSKGTHDFVTHVDLQSERLLTSSLSKIYPGAVFITEEKTIIQETGKTRWIIDPLDGTTNFMHGVAPYSISIALEEDGRIVVGVVHAITTGETYYSWENGGAWCDGKQIQVSSAATLADSLIATGFPYKNFENLDNYLAILGFFMKNSHGIRRMGSAAIDLAYVAAGKFDAFFEYNLNRWDVSAGIILIREAGGCVSDFSGNSEGVDGSNIVAANDILFEEFRSKVNTFMSQ